MSIVEPDLDSVIDAAIRESGAEADLLQGRIDAALAMLESVAEDARRIRVQDASALVETVAEELRECLRSISHLFDRQRSALGTFNIALFGRTGAGKSSLIEALTRGDGHRISQGESDWTTEVTPVAWRSCRVYDTPGIDGWGRSEKREVLEERARHAVEVADVVVLAFDTQNQLASEFDKIGGWIEEFGKPMVAVLNCRNARWRVPPEVPAAAARARVSQGVAEHASNIRNQLARIGLANAPLVAIHSRRAQWARATEPYRGPSAVEFEKTRMRYAASRLEAWSNLPAFEALLTEALLLDAKGLRLGMLREEVRRVLDRAARQLEATEAALNTSVEVRERQIAKALGIIGYPAAGSARDPLRLGGASEDLLTELERLRDDAFSAPSEGEIRRLTVQRFAARLGPLRTAARGRAEEVVLGAFDRREALSAKVLERAILDRNALQKAVSAVASDVTSYVNAQLNLGAREASLDLRTILWSAQQVEGARGSGWSRVGAGLRILGILAGVATGIGAVIAGGWAALAITAVGGAIGWLFDWGGKKARAKAEAKRLKARSSALADATRAVHKTFDEVQEHVQFAVVAELERHALGSLRAVVQEAVVCRRLTAALGRARTKLAEIRDAVPARRPPVEVFAQAAKRVEQRRYPKDLEAARKLWLGEDWITDPEGLRSAALPDERGDARARARQRTGVDSPRLRALMEGFASTAAVGDGYAWLNEAEHVLSGDDATHDTLASLARLARGRPKVFVCGDYSVGKTTFIRRLFVEVNRSVPSGLDVGAAPTTGAVQSYPWEGVDLVDTPGFQSGAIGHAAASLDAIPEASLVLWLFQPALVSGDPVGLDMFMRGDEAVGIVPKLRRTLFVIHRADELGPHPEEAPDEFANLCDRKTRELIAALASRGIDVAQERVFCMAADPFGLLTCHADATRADFDAWRGWDGFDEFCSVVLGARATWQHAAVDRSILESGVARFTSLAARAAAGIAAEEQRCTEIRSLSVLVGDALGELDRVREAFKAHLDRALADHAEALVAEALATPDEAKQEALAKRLARWWEDEHLGGEIERREEECRRSVEGLMNRLGDDLRRRLESASFRRAFPEAKAALDGMKTEKRSGGKLAAAARKLGDAMGSTTRAAVLRAARTVGVKFRPWGAVKFAKSLRIAGGLLSAVGTVLDVVAFVRDLRAEKGREGARRRIAKFVDESRAQVLESLMTPSDDGAGVVAYLRVTNVAIGKTAKAFDDDLVAHVARRDALTAKRERYLTLVESARRRLHGGSKSA